MQSSVSIGLKVKTHEPAPDTNTHTHFAGWTCSMLTHTYTHTHIQCIQTHTLMLGRLAMERGVTVSDRKRESSDWLRQLVGGRIARLVCVK